MSSVISEKLLYGRALIPSYKEKVLEVLRKAERPLFVTEVQRRAGIRSWYGAKSVLASLVLEGKVEALPTNRETLYRIKEPEKISIAESIDSFEFNNPRYTIQGVSVEILHKGDKVAFLFNGRETKPISKQCLKEPNLFETCKQFEALLLRNNFKIKEGAFREQFCNWLKQQKF